MTGEQVAAPSSPRDGEDVSITLGQPKVCYFVKLLLSAVGTLSLPSFSIWFFFKVA